MRPALLFTALLFALSAQAQAPLVANAPLAGTDFLRSGGAEPDTTEPWRYFPLAVGNAWEYDRYPTGLPHIDLGTRRVDVEKDTLIEGVRYVIHRDRFYDADGELESSIARTPIRFDTLTSTAQTPIGRPFYEVPCPLNVPFDAEVLCGDLQDPYVTYGGYDEGTLFFPETTLTVTYKGFANYLGFTTSYAAGYGRFALSFDNGDTHVLEYARIGGVEYGVPQFPVASEGTPAETDAHGLEAWPNPFRERLTVELDLSQAGAARMEVVDVLGRVVRRRDLGVLSPGRHELRLRTAGLAAGSYLVRLVAGGMVQATQTVTRLR